MILTWIKRRMHCCSGRLTFSTIVYFHSCSLRAKRREVSVTKCVVERCDEWKLTDSRCVSTCFRTQMVESHQWILMSVPSVFSFPHSHQKCGSGSALLTWRFLREDSENSVHLMVLFVEESKLYRCSRCWSMKKRKAVAIKCCWVIMWHLKSRCLQRIRSENKSQSPWTQRRMSRWPWKTKDEQQEECEVKGWPRSAWLVSTYKLIRSSLFRHQMSTWAALIQFRHLASLSYHLCLWSSFSVPPSHRKMLIGG